jgi:paraquat-inducible protein A
MKAMQHENDLIICPECDALYRMPRLRRGEDARCRRCDHVLARHARQDVEQRLALVLACGIFFLLANITPILKINVAGTQTEVTIWGAAEALGQGWIALAAAALIITMALVPAIQVTALAWLLLHANAGRRAPAFRELSCLLQALRPWSMTEVFLLGALVAVVKLSHWLPLDTGTGLWSLAAFTVLFTALGRFDRTSWWTLGAATWK